MNRNVILLLLFLVLGVSAYFIYSKGGKASAGDQIAIKNTNQIYKITLKSKKGKEILLTRKDKNWEVNGKYNVRPAAINLLKETFEEVRVHAFVAKAAEKNVRNEMKVNAITVKAYDKKNQLIKTLYIGGTAPGKIGTYFQQDNDDYIYVARIQNWEGLIRPRFMLNEEDWRDKSVFNFEAKTIKKVTVEYPDRPQYSFQIDQEGKDIEVTGFKGSTTPEKPLIKPKALYYLKGFERLIAEAFETENRKRDSLIQTAPFCQIHLETTQGEKRKVDLYPIAGNILENEIDGTTKRAQVERYFASIDDNREFMLVQHMLFQRILAPIEFFFTEEKKEG